MQKASLYEQSFYLLLICTLFIFGCKVKKLEKHGQHYQQHQDYESLKKAVDLIPLGEDTAYVRSILGAPIDVGFDFRYLLDSVGPKGCAFGAVFHIGKGGNVDQKWIGEICE
jgi:hypothetical protein